MDTWHGTTSHKWEERGGSNNFNGGGDIWRDDGTSDYSPHLIAEWTDAPTSVADIVAKHSQTGTAIVCLLENGKPKPATEPFVHGDAKAAEREALRLANVHKGKEFGVYTLGEVKKVERTFDHEWQRLAYGGEKIAGIKAYREAGGKRQVFVAAEFGWPARYEERHVIGLKEAKDAVEHWLATAA
jgi:hypothetical protein